MFSGHVHAYERTLGVYKSKYKEDGPMYITVGDGGNHELLYDQWKAPEEYNVFRDGTKYGHGRVVVHNRTHLEWIWEPNKAQVTNPRMVDRAWIQPVAQRGKVVSRLPETVLAFLVVLMVFISVSFVLLTWKSYPKGYEYTEGLLEPQMSDNAVALS